MHGTLEEMQAVCDADPNCGWLHDYSCDANNWRACGPTSDMAAGSAACTMVKTSSSNNTDVDLVDEEVPPSAIAIAIATSTFFAICVIVTAIRLPELAVGVVALVCMVASWMSEGASELPLHLHLHQGQCLPRNITLKDLCEFVKILGRLCGLALTRVLLCACLLLIVLGTYTAVTMMTVAMLLCHSYTTLIMGIIFLGNALIADVEEVNVRLTCVLLQVVFMLVPVFITSHMLDDPNSVFNPISSVPISGGVWPAATPIALGVTLVCATTTRVMTADGKKAVPSVLLLVRPIMQADGTVAYPQQMVSIGRAIYNTIFTCALNTFIYMCCVHLPGFVSTNGVLILGIGWACAGIAWVSMGVATLVGSFRLWARVFSCLSPVDAALNKAHAFALSCGFGVCYPREGGLSSVDEDDIHSAIGVTMGATVVVTISALLGRATLTIAYGNDPFIPAIVALVFLSACAVGNCCACSWEAAKIICGVFGIGGCDLRSALNSPPAGDFRLSAPRSVAERPIQVAEATIVSPLGERGNRSEAETETRPASQAHG